MAKKRYPKSWVGKDLLAEAHRIMALRADDFTDYGMAIKIFDWNKPIPYEASEEELEQYADIVTCAFPDAAFESISTDCVDVLKLNLTAWGNMAFVSRNAVDPKNKKHAKTVLEQWRLMARQINERMKKR